METDEAILAAGRDYEALFVPALFAPWTRHVIAAAQIKAGTRVLDLACGTGVLARAVQAVVGSGGKVIGVDPGPGMIATAKTIEPNIEWHLGAAEAIPLPDGTCDRVVSQFGMMFFQDRAQAAREMLRVLAPGGSITIAVWQSVEQNPAYGKVISLLDKHIGTDAGNALRMPYTLGDATAVEAELNEAGFVDVNTESKQEYARFPSVQVMVEAELRGWLPLFDINLSDNQINTVLTDAEKTLAEYVSPAGEAAFTTAANVITAKK